MKKQYIAVIKRRFRETNVVEFDVKLYRIAATSEEQALAAVLDVVPLCASMRLDIVALDAIEEL